MAGQTDIKWDRSTSQIQRIVDHASRGVQIPFTYHAWIDEYKQGWHDGDTPYIWMQIDPDHYWGRPGKPVKARVAALDCPELNVEGEPNPAGYEARDYARAWVLPGHEVMVTLAARDMYGRPLVVMKILPDMTDYTNHMIMHGYGKVYRYAPQTSKPSQEPLAT